MLCECGSHWVNEVTTKKNDFKCQICEREFEKPHPMELAEEVLSMGPSACCVHAYVFRAGTQSAHGNQAHASASWRKWSANTCHQPWMLLHFSNRETHRLSNAEVDKAGHKMHSTWSRQAFGMDQNKAETTPRTCPRCSEPNTTVPSNRTSRGSLVAALWMLMLLAFMHHGSTAGSGGCIPGLASKCRLSHTPFASSNWRLNNDSETCERTSQQYFLFANISCFVLELYG